MAEKLPTLEQLQEMVRLLIGEQNMLAMKQEVPESLSRALSYLIECCQEAIATGKEEMADRIQWARERLRLEVKKFGQNMGKKK